MVFWVYLVENKSWWLCVHTWADTHSPKHRHTHTHTGPSMPSSQGTRLSKVLWLHIIVWCLLPALYNLLSEPGSPRSTPWGTELNASNCLGGDAKKPWEGSGNLGQGNNGPVASKQATWVHLKALGMLGTWGASSWGSPQRAEKLTCSPSTPIPGGACSHLCQFPGLSGLQHGGQRSFWTRESLRHQGQGVLAGSWTHVDRHGTGEAGFHTMGKPVASGIHFSGQVTFLGTQASRG